MKTHSIVAAFAAVMVAVSSCGVLGGTTSTASSNSGSSATASAIASAVTPATTTPTSAAYTLGQSAGTAMKNIFAQYCADGYRLDMSNFNNLLNIASLAANIQSIKEAETDKTYYKDYAQGLVLGSENLVTEENTAQVIDGLAGLANINLDGVTSGASEKVQEVKAEGAAVIQNATEIANSVSTLMSLFKK